MAWRHSHTMSRKRPGVRQNGGGSSSQSVSREEEQGHLLLEEQCDDLTSQLDEKVSMLKNGLLDMGKMINSDIRDIDDIEKNMSHAGGMMDQAMDQFSQMMSKGGNTMMCKLAGFLFFVFVLFYFIIRSRQS